MDCELVLEIAVWMMWGALTGALGYAFGYLKMLKKFDKEMDSVYKEFNDRIEKWRDSRDGADWWKGKDNDV